MAAPALAQSPAHPRHLVTGAPAGNLAAAELELSQEVLERLNAIGKTVPA